MIVAFNENFVVPIPTTLKLTGFFKAAGNAMIVGQRPRRCRAPARRCVDRLERGRRGRRRPAGTGIEGGL